MPKTLFLSEQRRAQKTFMRGELIDDALLVELLSWMHQSRRQACLTLSELSDSSSKRGSAQSVKLYLHHGEVSYVSSQNPHHRLGAILLRRGSINEQQLHEVLSQLNGQRLGRALVSHQMISKEELIEALRDQALIILHFALTTPKYFGEARGQGEASAASTSSRRFCHFTASTYHPYELPLNLHIEIQGLLLEVLRQQDEVQSLLPSMPSLDACPRATRRVTLDDPPEVSFALQQSGGYTPLRTLIFMNPISALDALKLYRELLLEGSLQVTDELWSAPDASASPPELPPQVPDEETEWFDLNFTPEI